MNNLDSLDLKLVRRELCKTRNTAWSNKCISWWNV